MPKTIHIPPPLRKLTNNKEFVEVNATTLGDAITELESRCPGITKRLVDENGELRRFVNFYVNGENVRFLRHLATSLEDGDVIEIIPEVVSFDSAAAAMVTAERLRAGEKFVENLN